MEKEYPRDMTDTSTTEVAPTAKDYKVEKYQALYSARAVLSEVGTMQERSICRAQLKRMQKLGLAAL